MAFAFSGLGLIPFLNTAVVNAPVAVSTLPARMHGVHIENSNGAKMYLHFYDASPSNVIVGTTVPKKTLFVPSGGYDFDWALPVAFNTTLTIAATTTPGGSTTPGVGLLVNVDYLEE